MHTRKGLRRTASGDRRYHRRTERRKQQKTQSMEASSAKLRVEKPHRERQVAKITRKKRKKRTRGAVRPIHLSSAGGVTWEKPSSPVTQDGSLATESLRVHDDLPQLEEARTTDSLARAENGWLGGYAGWGAGTARRTRVTGDGEYGRGGRDVGVGGGRMGSTRDRGGNGARWKRWDWRECVLEGRERRDQPTESGLGRRGTFWFSPSFLRSILCLRRPERIVEKGKLKNIGEGGTGWNISNIRYPPHRKLPSRLTPGGLG
ncbi:hypothetical protein JB92DRAFT_3100357 [Gautieria morchelliformis]|nr:hypothetical protein JB92DRAFT_3100357 [Gautieria morchelliformis]